MEPFEDDRLVTALESLRPAPRPAFAAELDERAAAGFPQRPRPAGSPLSRLAARLRSFEPRRALVPAGATALAAVAAVTVVVAVSENGATVTQLSLPSTEDAAPSPAGSSEQSPSSSGSAGAQHDAGAPMVQPSGQAGSAASAESLSAPNKTLPNDSGPYASRTAHREIERSAQMVLGAEPSEVRRAASEVFEAVHAQRGIVLSSSIRDGAEGEAGARFELLIPSARLGDALAAFSGIAEVRSRQETSADITAPTVRTGEQLRDSRAKIEGLLAQLAQADTDAERSAAEAQLRAERRHSAYLRSQLSGLQRRANLSRVSLRIDTGTDTTSPGTTGGWGIGDALNDAGRLLAIAAAVTIVALAILAPIGLIALLAWLANRARIRRARHRALAH